METTSISNSENAELELIDAINSVKRYMCILDVDLKSPISMTGHATVYTAYSMTYRKQVAIKIIHRDGLPPEVAYKFLPRELQATRLAHHPHLCKCLLIVEPNPLKIVVVSEFYTGGNLLHFLQRDGAISETNAARMFRQLIEAVQFLHDHSVVHRDIKLANILLDEKVDIKLADFGFARYISRSESSTSFCGSKPHQAPNITRAKPYDAYAADWYAVGITLYAMLTGIVPEEQVDPMTKQYRALKFPKGRPSAAARRLIEHLTCENENKRAGYEECLKSDWLRVHTNRKWMMADSCFIYEMLK